MRGVVATAAMLGLLAGCGGSSTPEPVLAATTERLGGVRAATMDLRVTATSAALDGREVGFAVRGPFDVDSGTTLPVAELTVERLGADGEPTTLLSTGERAYLRRGDATYELPPDSTSSLALGEKDGGGAPSLDLARWVDSPTVVEGDETDTVSGEVDVAAFLSDLAAVSSRFGESGGGLTDLSPEAQAEVADAVTESSMTAVVDHDDRDLRSVVATVVLGRPDPDLPEETRRLVPVTITLSLQLTDVGERLTVTAPTNVRPLSELKNG